MSRGHRAARATTIALALLTALFAATCDDDDAPRRRGAFAFHYGPSLSEEAMAWYSRFELLVTHDPLPREQVERLHRAGTRLVLYEWAVAFYETRATEWQRALIGKSALLNATALTGGAGSAVAPAWYFDPAAPEHAGGRAADLAKRIREAGYDGVFLDTTTIASVHAEARAEYERRHPEIAYDAAFARFLVALRKEMPGVILFTNQGYRSAEHYLPYVDWDLTESLITRPDGKGGHRLRAWDDPAAPWESIRFVMERELEPVMARYPNVRFAHLNYADANDPETIRAVVAIAQLFGGEGYVAAPSPPEEINEIYFRDPGKPRAARVDVGDASYRVFEHGVIAVRPADGVPRAYFAGASAGRIAR